MLRHLHLLLHRRRRPRVHEPVREVQLAQHRGREHEGVEIRQPHAALVHAVQDQAVKVNVQVGGRAETLDQRDRAAVGFRRLEPSVAEQVACDQAVHRRPGWRTAEYVNDFATPGVMNLLCRVVDGSGGVFPVRVG